MGRGGSSRTIQGYNVHQAYYQTSDNFDPVCDQLLPIGQDNSAVLSILTSYFVHSRVVDIGLGPSACAL